MKETAPHIKTRFQEIGVKVQTTWQQSLILMNHRELLVSKISLRHNYERIPIHKIANQLFCEMKIEFDEKYPSERSPEKIEGLIIHDSLIPTKKEDIETVISIIENGRDVFAKFGTYFSYKGVVIIGVHDGIFFQNGVPLYLLEIKSTKGTINEVYPSEKIQAYLYALALESMGFDTSQLLIIILKVKMNIERSSLIKAIRDYLNKGIIDKFNKEYPNAKIHQFDYSEKSKEEIINKLDNLIRFWTKERMPNYSDRIGRCRTCKYKVSPYNCSNPELK